MRLGSVFLIFILFFYSKSACQTHGIFMSIGIKLNPNKFIIKLLLYLYSIKKTLRKSKWKCMAIQFFYLNVICFNNFYPYTKWVLNSENDSVADSERDGRMNLMPLDLIGFS